jgi:multidrug efflux system outer membrane protein
MGLGSAITAFGNFLTGPASGWLLAYGLTGTIFAFGAIEGQLRAAEAQEQQAPHLYRRTILSAFRETNGALVGSQTEIEEVAMQGLCVDALFVSVCRAMGGDWVDIADSLTPRPQGVAAATSLQ